MTIIVALVTLVLFDGLLTGFRAAAGRDGRIAKRAYYRRAVARGAMAALFVVAGHAMLTTMLVASAPDPAGAWQDLLRAGEDCVIVFGSFATLTIVAIVFWFAPNRELRLLPTLLVLGPLTLVRPFVIACGLTWTATRTPTPQVWIAAIAAAVAVLAVEPLLSRDYAERWRHLLEAGS